MHVHDCMHKKIEHFLHSKLDTRHKSYLGASHFQLKSHSVDNNINFQMSTSNKEIVYKG